jgi:hypothetical protein
MLRDAEIKATTSGNQHGTGNEGVNIHPTPGLREMHIQRKIIMVVLTTK